MGTYNIGLRPIRLYANPNSNDGSVNVIPKDNGSTKVNIGIDQSWSRAVATLLHETYEIALIDLNTRFEQNPVYSNESSDFVFFMTHNELGEAHERIGELLENVLPDFRKIYDRHSPRKKRK